ncbi:MAG: SRPBCC family protein [Candidatus Bathyarchaeia archaeon]
MVRVEKSIEIMAPPEKVWEMFALDRCPEWMDDLKSVEYTSEVHTPEDKYRVGASTHWIKVKGEEFDVEVTESIENEKITTRTSPIQGATMIATFAVKPTEAGTEMSYVVDYEMPWGILGKILDKLFIRRALKKDITGEAEKLKSILEK